MICDRTEQIDIREVIKAVGVLPKFVDFRGERLRTTWSKTNFDGRRQWFLCPSCGRRCAIIYLKGDGPLWGCRVCMGGRYVSESKSRSSRKLRKALKIRARLGQKTGGIVVPFPDKPKGMHWKTYWRIRFEAAELELGILIKDLSIIRHQSVEEVRQRLAIQR